MDSSISSVRTRVHRAWHVHAGGRYIGAVWAGTIASAQAKADGLARRLGYPTRSITCAVTVSASSTTPVVVVRA